MEYIINALVGVLTPLISALGAWWVARKSATKALSVCESARIACNDEVHLLKDKFGTMQIAMIADKARILALENYVKEQKNAS